jgi:hypothetical protein
VVGASHPRCGVDASTVVPGVTGTLSAVSWVKGLVGKRVVVMAETRVGVLL